MTVFSDNTADPAAYPDEVAFLPTVIGNFTAAIMDLRSRNVCERAV